ncbi:MAG: pyruvate, phosphate dikinase [Candidatus Aenigmarchaeota archaeon]|nr:pyruvate, phosphate dikinase [Candidatus Aenigmarchaeota archaeon]
MVYMFDEVKGGNTPENIILLGNKGAQLSEMTGIGLPVPPGFTITTKACVAFYEEGKKWPAGLESQVKKELSKLEENTGKKLGGSQNPLFLSVRSGSYVSMPGMMDTVLNLGMNDQSVLALAKMTDNERGAWDSYRRFIQMFGDVVMGIEHSKFEEMLDKLKENCGAKYDTDLTAENLKDLVEDYKKLVHSENGKSFPDEPWEQLKMSIDAVFGSWNNNRAIKYRKIHKLRNDAGTGVNVQSMVFGNLGNDCATGVGFTRNPSNGDKEHYGEYLINAQGEDVVAGIRTPKHIDDLKKEMPKAYEELVKIYGLLEKHYRDMQDFEFTIEKGKLFILQTRSGKRTVHAAVKIAVDMEREGIIDKKKAVMRIKPEQLDQLLHKQLDPVAKEKEEPVAKGLPASPGAAVGKVVFTAEEAARMVDENPDEKVVLVRTETSPEDIEGMHAAEGILTARGGMTSHAAVVARGMGKCCVAGCDDIVVSESERSFKIPSKNNIIIREGECISLDGSTGEVFVGKIDLIEPEISGEFGRLMEWVDGFKKLKVKANADTPHDASIARKFGAEGIGLCRTEHMFFKPERIMAMREMILADNLDGRKRALDKILPYQKEDFRGLFKVMGGLPIIIRLLDPPLHEFLPSEDRDITEVAESMGVSPEKIRDTIKNLHELNPMLGFRGCRLTVKYPEITEMQARAIFEAALEAKEEGHDPKPEIEVPLIGNVREFSLVRKIIDGVAEDIGIRDKIKYKVGTMIEVPRAALTADEIAKEADFMSFGTNDLTQMGCGFSRDDSGKFLGLYVEKGLYEMDPFQSIDQEGVGKLMRICIDNARKTNPKIEIGICGEHGGEPESVKFCHKIGLNDVSCSPFRVPIARLAAAQAAIEQ